MTLVFCAVRRLLSTSTLTHLVTDKRRWQTMGHYWTQNPGIYTRSGGRPPQTEGSASQPLLLSLACFSATVSYIMNNHSEIASPVITIAQSYPHRRLQMQIEDLCVGQDSVHRASVLIKAFYLIIVVLMRGF